MVMHARKIPRLNDGFYERGQTHSFEDSYSSKREGYGDRYAVDKYRDHMGSYRGTRDPSPSRNSLRYQKNSSYVERTKDRREKGCLGSPSSRRTANHHQVLSDRHTHRNSDSSSGSRDHKKDIQKSASRIHGDWSEHVSRTGQIYFFNIKTEVSQWEPPKGWPYDSKVDSSRGSRDKNGRESRYQSSSKASNEDYRYSSSNQSGRSSTKGTAPSSSRPPTATSSNDRYSLAREDRSRGEYRSSTSSASREGSRHIASRNSSALYNGGAKTTPKNDSEDVQRQLEDMDISPGGTPSSLRIAQSSSRNKHYKSSSHTNQLHENSSRKRPAAHSSSSKPVSSQAKMAPHSVASSSTTLTSASQRSTGATAGGSSQKNLVQTLETLQKLQQALSQQLQQKQQKQHNTSFSSPSPKRPHLDASYSAGVQANVVPAPAAVQVQSQPAQQQRQQRSTSTSSQSPAHHSRQDEAPSAQTLASPVSDNSTAGKQTPKRDSPNERGATPSSTPSHTESSTANSTPLTTSSLSAAKTQCSSVQITPSLANYYKSDLIQHVNGWPADTMEAQANRFGDDSHSVGSINCTRVSTELKRARSLVRLTEIQATLQEQRLLFLQQQIEELDNLKTQHPFMEYQDT